jgi:hypothetical protein
MIAAVPLIDDINAYMRHVARETYELHETQGV